MHKRCLLTLLVVFLLVILSSCGSPDNESNPENTATFTPTNTNTPIPTNTPTNTPTPTATKISCFTLIAPEDGAEFGTMGQITFEWSEQLGANQYQIEITLPSGNVESKIIEGTTYNRYLESLPPGGEYTWQVSSLNDSTGSICISGLFTFTKTQYISQSSGGSSGDNSTCPPGEELSNGHCCPIGYDWTGLECIKGGNP